MSDGDDPKRASRRAVLQGGAVTVGAAVAAAAVWRSLASTGSHQAGPELLGVVADLMIPATDTPGALAANIPQFVTLALQHGLAGSRGDELDRLEVELDSKAGGRFTALGQAQRLAVLTALDAATVGHGPKSRSAWPTVKALILMGYYTSEIGAAQEQRYELVPGRWDPDIPYKPGDRGYSSDWVGVLF